MMTPSCMKRIKNYDASTGEGVGVPWSDLGHDVLLLVMMRLRVVDFLAFSGVCKTWRSLALPNKKTFMASRPPMSLSIPLLANEKACYLEDFEGRKFKTIIPGFAGKKCFGLTCGYLILFETKTRDLWLVNLITRDQLHFPSFPHNSPIDVDDWHTYLGIKAILVFSPSTSRWVLTIAQTLDDRIWFSDEGKGVWNHVSTNSSILDLHAFKGKIYAINIDNVRGDVSHLCEVRLGLEPKFMLLETKNFSSINCPMKFVSSSENLFVIMKISYLGASCNVHQLEFGEMKWVFSEKTMGEYVFYGTYMIHNVAVKRESWWPADIDKTQKGTFFSKFFSNKWWYFPHDCLHVNILDE